MEITRAEFDYFRIVRVKVEHGFRHQCGGQCEDERDDGRGEDAHTQHFANGTNLLLAPELRGEDGHAAGCAEQEQNENEKYLVGQTKRGYGGFAQLPDHDDVYHIERHVDKLLK